MSDTLTREQVEVMADHPTPLSKPTADANYCYEPCSCDCHEEDGDG